MVLGENLKRLDSQILNLILRKVWLKVKNLQHEKTLWKHCDRISHTTNTLNVHLKIFSPNPSPGLVAFDSPTHVSHSGEYTSDSALNNASDLSIPTSPSPGGGISHNGCPTNGRQDCSLTEVHAHSSEVHPPC